MSRAAVIRSFIGMRGSMQDLNNAHWLASAVWELPHKRVCLQNKHLQLKFKLFTLLCLYHVVIEQRP